MDRSQQHHERLDYLWEKNTAAIDGALDGSMDVDRSKAIIAGTHVGTQIVKVGVDLDMHLGKLSEQARAVKEMRGDAAKRLPGDK
ncbi:MAG TPA: hypothetical protein VF188_06575 [Longimicrobiales bacterium]